MTVEHSTVFVSSKVRA